MLAQMHFTFDDVNETITYGEIRIGYQEVAESNSEIINIYNDIKALTLPDYAWVKSMMLYDYPEATEGWMTFNYCRAYGYDGTNFVNYGVCCGAGTTDWSVAPFFSPFA